MSIGKSETIVFADFNRKIAAIKAAIADGNSRKTKEKALEAMSVLDQLKEFNRNPNKQIEYIQKRLSDVGITLDKNIIKDFGVSTADKVVTESPPPNVEMPDDASPYQIGKKKYVIPNSVILAIEEFHQRVRTVGDAVMNIYERGKSAGLDNFTLREIIEGLMSMYGKRTIIRALPDELKQDYDSSNRELAKRANIDANNLQEQSEPVFEANREEIKEAEIISSGPKHEAEEFYSKNGNIGKLLERLQVLEKANEENRELKAALAKKSFVEATGVPEDLNDKATIRKLEDSNAELKFLLETKQSDFNSLQEKYNEIKQDADNVTSKYSGMLQTRVEELTDLATIKDKTMAHLERSGDSLTDAKQAIIFLQDQLKEANLKLASFEHVDRLVEPQPLEWNIGEPGTLSAIHRCYDNDKRLRLNHDGKKVLGIVV